MKGQTTGWGSGNSEECDVSEQVPVSLAVEQLAGNQQIVVDVSTAHAGAANFYHVAKPR